MEISAQATTAGNGRTRNPRGEGARLRDEIVQAALRLIDRAGAEAVTLRAVARAAGISAPSIYGHFENREDILDAVIQQCFTELADELVAARDECEDPVERLQAGCEAYLAFAARRPHRYSLLFREPDPEDGTPFGEAGDKGAAAFATLVDGITACIAAGRSASTDPFNDAVALWSGLHGYASLSAAQCRFPWPAREDTLERIVRGLARVDAVSRPAQ